MGPADNSTDKAAGCGNVTKAGQYAFISEKGATQDPEKPINVQDVAAAILSALHKADNPGHDLDLAVQDIVSQAGGWYEHIAIAVLTALRNALMEGSPMRQAMGVAFEKARDAAAGIADFAREHPLYTAAICAVIALGILVILAPSVIAALGFSELGPVEGKVCVLVSS